MTRMYASAHDRSLLASIDIALAELAEMERGHEEGAKVIAALREQLSWSRSFVESGAQPFPLPGAFTMGLIAARHFDMHGNKPKLAELINSIQREVSRRIDSVI